MRTRYVKKIILVLTIILGLILSSFSSVSSKAMIPDEEKISQISPQGDIVFLNNTEPIIDGNLESYSGEWENATVQTVSIGPSQNAISITIRVQANSTNLFMGISYTSATYIDYNTDNHTWLAIVFDNNFDALIGSSNITADDCVAINYRQLGGQDMFINGTTYNSMIGDNNATGVENSVAVLDKHLDDFNRYEVSIEISKELKSEDTAGRDIELNDGDTVSYLVILFQNSTANYNYTELFNRVSQWKSFRLYPTYEYFSYEEDLSAKSVLTYISDSQNSLEHNLSVINNILYSYGFNITEKSESSGYEFEYNVIHSYDLIILVGALNDLTDNDVEALRFYTASGGSLYILSEVSADTKPVNRLLENFGLQIFNSTVFSEDLGVNSTITLDSADIADIPYFTDSSILSNQDVTSIFYQGSALNFTNNGTSGEMYIQFQQGDLYATLNKTGEFYVDLDDDRMYNSSVDYNLNDSAVFQAAVELQRGGKLIATASADIFNSSNIIKADNKYLFISQVEWLFNLQHLLSYEDFGVEETEISAGGFIHVHVTVYGDNDTSVENLHVWVVILELKADRNQEDLVNTGDNRHFNGTITPASTIKADFVDVTIRMHKRGYGYNQTELYEIYVQPTVGHPISIDYLAMILFIVSLGLVILGGFATIKYRSKEEEV